MEHQAAFASSRPPPQIISKTGNFQSMKVRSLPIQEFYIATDVFAISFASGHDQRFYRHKKQTALMTPQDFFLVQEAFVSCQSVFHGPIRHELLITFDF